MLRHISDSYRNYGVASVMENGTTDSGRGISNDSLKSIVEYELESAMEFLADHQYHASYKTHIQHPKLIPMQIVETSLKILRSSGLYCVDKAAFNLLAELDTMHEKKDPNSRHALLLAVVATCLTKIRAIIGRVFKLYTEKERIYKFSSSKLLQLFEIIRQFKPTGDVPSSVYTCSCDLDRGMGTVVPLPMARNVCMAVAHNGRGDVMPSLLPMANFQPGVSQAPVVAQMNCLGDLVLNPCCNGWHYKPRPTVKPKLCGGCVDQGHKKELYQKLHRNFIKDDGSELRGVIFVNDVITANMLYQVLNNLQCHDKDYDFLVPQYVGKHVVNLTVHQCESNIASEAQVSYWNAEGLKRFCRHQCNLLVAMTNMENDIDVECNLVLQYNQL